MVRLAVATRGSRITGGDRLDAGVRAGPERVGVQQQDQHPPPTHLGIQQVGADLGRDVAGHGGGCPGIPDDRTDDQQEVGEKEEYEDWQQDLDRFFHAAEVQDDQGEDGGPLGPEFPRAPLRAHQPEQGVAGSGDRHGDRQRVIHQQRAAGDHADARSEELGGHQVSAAAAGELLDDVAVAGRDDEHGGHDGRGQEHGQAAVGSEIGEGLGRAVAGRRQPVRPQTHPRQKGDQRHVLEDRLVGQVPRPADQDGLHLVGQRGLGCVAQRVDVFPDADHLGCGGGGAGAVGRRGRAGRSVDGGPAAPAVPGRLGARRV